MPLLICYFIVTKAATSHIWPLAARQKKNEKNFPFDNYNFRRQNFEFIISYLSTVVFFESCVMTAKTITMKKIIVLSFVIATALGTKAQTTPWINQGAIWNYKYWNIGINGVVKIEYTHDTILFGKTCQILKTTEDVYTQSPPIVLVNSGDWNNYTYNNGDTVFYLNNNQFNTLLHHERSKQTTPLNELEPFIPCSRPYPLPKLHNRCPINNWDVRYSGRGCMVGERKERN